MARKNTKSSTAPESRIPVLKTYKLFIGGSFPRSESERSYPVFSAGGTLVAYAARSSRKDLRNAVTAAKKGFESWSEKTPYNRAQILYRMAEMLEARREQFERELQRCGESRRGAQQQVSDAIDSLVHYAGWADKAQHLLSSINPVTGPYFNFSTAEPLGVVALITAEEGPLLSMIQALGATLAAGNAAVIIPPAEHTSVCLSFAEVVVASDVPAGTINILAGLDTELIPQVGSHLEIEGVLVGRGTAPQLEQLRSDGSENLKRFIPGSVLSEPLAALQSLSEIRTTWHPVAV